MTKEEKFNDLLKCFEKSNLQNDIIKKLYIQVSNIGEDQFSDRNLFDCIGELCSEIDKFPDEKVNNIEKLNEEINNLKEKIFDLEGTISGYDDEVDDLTYEIDKLKDQIKDLEFELSNADETISDLESDLYNEKEENENLRMRLHE